MVKERAVELQIGLWMRSDAKVSSFLDESLLASTHPIVLSYKCVTFIYSSLFPPHKHSLIMYFHDFPLLSSLSSYPSLECVVTSFTQCLCSQQVVKL
jgi:hypothetical protein